jgi:hypothetical protein
MAIRNFYVDGDIDGRSTRLTGGPKGAGGGMSIDFKQRHEGQILNVFSVSSAAKASVLETWIEFHPSVKANEIGGVRLEKTERGFKLTTYRD